MNLSTQLNLVQNQKKAILFVQKIKDLNAINDYLNKELKGKVDQKAKTLGNKLFW